MNQVSQLILNSSKTILDSVMKLHGWVQICTLRESFGSKDCTKELKPECAYFLGQTS